MFSAAVGRTSIMSLRGKSLTISITHKKNNIYSTSQSTSNIIPLFVTVFSSYEKRETHFALENTEQKFRDTYRGDPFV